MALLILSPFLLIVIIDSVWTGLEILDYASMILSLDEKYLMPSSSFLFTLITFLLVVCIGFLVGDYVVAASFVKTGDTDF